jgi:hypothetical protein
MSRYKKLAEALQNLAADSIIHMPLINAEVISVENESCTVKIDDVEIDEVRLKATINGTSNKVLLKPKVGSMVLIGSLTGDLKDLAVLNIDELEKLQYEQDGLLVEIDSTDAKIKIANADTSLYELLQSLANLLKQFKVHTPVGPSGTPLPDTITAIEQFETSFKKILK